MEKAETSDRSVVRSTGSMAVATLMSRITGFIRTVMITSALGGAVASAFISANTLPNMVTEIVLGSVLTALVVPVLVRAEKEDPDHGASFIRRLFTLTFTLVTVATVITLVGAPLLTRLMLDGDGQVNVVQATSFAYLLLPQIMFYGLFSLFMAVLNTKEVFRPGAWAPVANNVVTITVMALYMLVPGSIHPDDPTPVTDPHVLLLGLGTTFGVVVQCLIMLPALRRTGVDLRLEWGIDDRLKQFGGMALAIITYVAISQVGYIINNRIASSVHESAPIIYANHWLLLQVPYGIIGVTLLTAIMPRLSRNAADGDDQAVVRDLTLGTKLTFIAIIPIIMFMTALGPDIGTALFRYGNFSSEDARTLGLTLSFSAFALIPYALVMLHLRVFYAREEAWTPTFIIAGITFTKVVLALLAPFAATRPDQVVVLLGAANGFGFVAGAVIGSFLLRSKLGSLGTGEVLKTSAWAAAAGLVGVGAVFAVRSVVRMVSPERSSVGMLIEIAVLGIIFVAVTAVVLSFSNLPEVETVMQRFRRSTPVEETAPVLSTFMMDDTFNASPVPPPMSAGVVRGPRLIPGAAVSDGRFRLLKDHGAATGARFWQAREQKTGRIVALTFVDTCGAAPLAPVAPRQAAIDAAGVTHRTNRLRELQLSGVAPILEAIPYRMGCLVVSDWIPGSSLKAVAESGAPLLEQAVDDAMVPLKKSVSFAHQHGVPLGLDNRDRMRVTEDGAIVLAFPAVLPGADLDSDNAALGFAEELLHNLSGEGPGETVQVPVEQEIDTPPVRGFGERGLGAFGITALVAVAISAVLMVALLTTYVLSQFRDEPDNPVRDVATESGPASQAQSLPVFIAPLTVEPENFAPLVDGDRTTTATVTPGQKFTITTDDPFITDQMIFHTEPGPGLKYTIYGLTGGNREVLAEGTLTGGPQHTVDITDNPTLKGLEIAFTGAEGTAVAVQEVSVVGKRVLHTGVRNN
ncbi:murein biosynthesis integral membrane protein MurJ [Corynebacterium sp. CCUG 59401]|nr:murein biosynthesis integral membrane protein MurJ [Corynebacterium pseudogenitalium]